MSHQTSLFEATLKANNQSFQPTLERAIERKGGKKALLSLLTDSNSESVADQPDSYFLEEMTRSIFQSGFVWRVINNKWPQFREAFQNFDLDKLMALSDEEWDGFMGDTRVVRHRIKLRAVRHNLWFVNETGAEHGGFGQFLANWPKTELVDLFAYLKKYGSRLGGHTGQYFLRHVGLDSYVLNKDVVLSLKLHGLDISDNPTSQKDLKKVQEQFNQWQQDSGLPYRHLSMIAAFSAGVNRSDS
ncbi:MAG: 3-methyladenine DNA glycosylase Tag [Parasphingorhabdus sp.]|jgi:3-methyladenine DNA glycosylase Tag